MQNENTSFHFSAMKTFQKCFHLQGSVSRSDIVFISYILRQKIEK